jgi:hypothetical protein
MPSLTTSLDPSIYNNIKAPEQTSLGDMINMARGSLAYKKEKELYAPSIRKAEADTQSAETSAASSEFDLKQKKRALMLNVATPFSKNKDVLEAANLPPNASPEQLEAAKNKLLHINDSMKRDLEAAGMSKVDIAQHMLPLDHIALTQPNAYAQHLDYGIQSAAGATNIASQNQPALTDVGGQKGFATPATQTYNPINISGAPAGSATAGSASVAGTNNAAPAATPAAGGEMPNLVPTDPAFRSTTPTNLSNLQKERYDYGRALILDQAQTTPKVQEGLQTLREVDKYAYTAAGSAPGKVLRAAGQWIGGNTNYDLALKNIARTQQEAAQRMGVKSDLGAETNALANGSADITEKALRTVNARAQADLGAVPKFNQGLENFVKKHGEINGSMNAEIFQRQWAQNYDSRIFMRDQILNSNKGKLEKEFALKELGKTISPSEVDTLRRKAIALKRLENGDYAKGY